MKTNIVFCFVFFCLAATELSAQSFFGIKGGLGLSSYYGSDWEASQDSNGTDNQVAPLTVGGGIFGCLGLNDFLAVQSEILFTSQSVQYGNGSDYTRVRYTVVDIPFYLKGIFWRRDDRSRLYVVGGPEYKTILGNVKQEEPGKETKSISVDEFIDHSRLWGIAIGVGYEVEKRYGLWTFGIKYSRGISDLWNGSNTSLNKIMLEAGFGLKG